MKTFAFPVTYGAWGRILTFAPLNLTMQLMHRKTIIISFGNSNETMEISCITATTPGTYYSGYREYGKFIFVVPDYVKHPMKRVLKDGQDGAISITVLEDDVEVIKQVEAPEEFELVPDMLMVEQPNPWGLVKAIQELEAELASLKERVAILEAK